MKTTKTEKVEITKKTVKLNLIRCLKDLRRGVRGTFSRRHQTVLEHSKVVSWQDTVLALQIRFHYIENAWNVNGTKFDQNMGKVQKLQFWTVKNIYRTLITIFLCENGLVEIFNKQHLKFNFLLKWQEMPKPLYCNLGIFILTNITMNLQFEYKFANRNPLKIGAVIGTFGTGQYGVITRLHSQ